MRRPSLGAIFLTVAIDLLGFGIVMPFLAEEARDSFHTTAFVGTLLGSMYSLMQFLFVPVWGRVSDAVGRRPVLVWSVGASAVAMAGLGFALAFGDHVAWLFAARIFSGIATANLGTASAYIADITAPEERSKGMGLIGMAFGLGFILGPPIGGLLAPILVNGRQGAVPCFVAAGLSVVNFVWVVFGLGESLPKDRRSATKARELSPFNTKKAREAFALPGVAVAVLANFVAIVAFAGMNETFRFFNKDLFGMTKRDTAYALAFIGVTAAFVQGGVIRPLAKRWGDAPLVRIGFLLQAIGFTGLVVAPSFGRPAIYAFGAFLAFGNGLVAPSLSAYVSKCAPSNAQGSTLGTSQSIASLARVAGPALGGFLYGALGPRVPYVNGAVLMIVALLLALPMRSHAPDGAQNTSTQTS
ncbi:MAG: MFS transporter [Polyangiaceae bacterium]